MRFSSVLPIGICVFCFVGCAGSNQGSADDSPGVHEGGSAGDGATALGSSSAAGSGYAGNSGNLVSTSPALEPGSAPAVAGKVGPATDGPATDGAATDGAPHPDAGAEQDGDGAPDGGLTADGGVTPEVPSTNDGSTVAGSALGAIPLTTPDGTYYMAQLAVGNQTFLVDVDTGSATAALAGASCASCKSARVATLYAPTATAADQRATTRSTYGDGSGWNGEIYRDTVGLGHGTPNVQLDLVSITTQNMFFGRGAFDGILGLGPSGLALRGTNAYPTQLFATGVAPVLAFELCASSGTMWIGGFDASAASSEMQYTPLVAKANGNGNGNGNANAFYRIDMSDLSIGGTSLGFHAADFASPIVDTGTSLFYFPTKVFQAIISAITASQGYKSVFGTARLSANGNGCVRGAGATAAQVDAALPALAVTLPSRSGGSNFTLSVRPTQSYLRDGGGGQFCLAMGDGGTQIGTLLGDTFLSSFVTVIDQQNAQVGFAPESGCRIAHSHRTIDPAAWPPVPPRPLLLR